MASALDMVAGAGQYSFDPLGDIYEGRKTRSALNDMNRADQARPLMGQALQGDANALNSLAGIDPQGFMDVSGFQDKRVQAKAEQAAAKAEKVAAILYRADTPEAWSQAINYLKKTGHDISPEEENFANKDAVLGEFLSLKDQMAQGNSDRSYNLEVQKMNQPDKPTASIQEYEYAKENGFTGSLIDFEMAKKGEGIEVTSPDGTTMRVGGKGPKVTEGMRRAAGFKASMKSSIDNLDSTFTALTDPRNYAGDKARNYGGRAMMTPEGQQAADSFDEVVADALYVASGATLTAPEVERKKAAIIPTPNDDKKTIEAKRKRLDDLMAAVDVMAGQESQPKQDAGGWTILPNGVKIRKKTQ